MVFLSVAVLATFTVALALHGVGRVVPVPQQVDWASIIAEKGSSDSIDGRSLSSSLTGGAEPVANRFPVPAVLRRSDRYVEVDIGQKPPSPVVDLLPRVGIAVSALDTPILMYHHVGPLPSNPDAIRRGLTVSQGDFAAQVRLLATSGFQSISLLDLMLAFRGYKQLPPKPVIITFDDGYDDNYRYALPILKENGMKATFFIVTDLVGKTEYLTWQQITEMAGEGMSMQAHGVSHIDLSVLPPSQVLYQITESRRAIEAHTGRRVRFYAYPSGKFNDGVVAALKENGYLAAASTLYGTDHRASEPFILKRVRVQGGESLQSFARKLKIAK
ncbi:MAG: polysaccharide deacetylase family protein [Chloroflexi bacterium]|nr:polysaccharide deacetylase family protein [Chloroflexota bacterium]